MVRGRGEAESQVVGERFSGVFKELEEVPAGGRGEERFQIPVVI